jgi:hypothetical protein
MKLSLCFIIVAYQLKKFWKFVLFKATTFIIFYLSCGVTKWPKTGNLDIDVLRFPVVFYDLYCKWAASRQNQHNGFASAQCDQDPCCSLTYPIASSETDSEQHGSWSDCADVSVYCEIRCVFVIAILIVCYSKREFFHITIWPI